MHKFSPSSMHCLLWWQSRWLCSTSTLRHYGGKAGREDLCRLSFAKVLNVQYIFKNRACFAWTLLIILWPPQSEYASYAYDNTCTLVIKSIFCKNLNQNRWWHKSCTKWSTNNELCHLSFSNTQIHTPENRRPWAYDIILFVVVVRVTYLR